jgi:DHA1 family bicyclomycin/chloramphenicol resistance-like MFS transporter
VIRFVPETLPPVGRLPIRVGPLLLRYWAILRERGFLTNALIGSFAMAALFTYLGGSTVVFMNQYGLTPRFYSWLLVVVAVVTIGLLRLNRWLVGRAGWGFERAAYLDLGVFLAGGVLLVPLVWWSAPWPLVLLGLLACSAGFTCVQPNVQPGALREHQVRRGSAQALMSTLQYGGGAVATAVLGWLADGTGRPMALLILVFALAALIAAWCRPRGEIVSL